MQRFSRIRPAAAAVLALFASAALHAQTAGTTSDPAATSGATSGPMAEPADRGRVDRMSGTSDYNRDAWSLLPGTRRGYVGINLGKPDYRLGSGTGLFDNDDPDAGLHVYTGGLFNDWLGAEVGYLNMGKADRGGGTTRAQGLNLSLVARAPIGQFSVFGKVGATYGRTKVSADLLSGLDEGSASGWGRSYGAGVGFDFTPSSGLVVEWARHRFRFAGDGRDDVDMTSIGYIHRF